MLIYGRHVACGGCLSVSDIPSGKDTLYRCIELFVKGAKFDFDEVLAGLTVNKIVDVEAVELLNDEMEKEKIHRRVSTILSDTAPGVGYTHVLCCPCCAFFTLSSANLRKHATGHEKEKLSSYRTYTCSKCLSLSTERDLMMEHVNIYHTNTKSQVELTEEIHTIIRRDVFEEDNKMNKYKRSGIKIERNLKKIKWRSRIKRLKNFSARRCINKRVLKTQSSTSEIAIEREKYSGTEEEVLADEPIDMSLKTQQKTESKAAYNSNGNIPSNADYASLYSNIKGHLLDMLTKSPISANLSNPLLMRYISSQMHSIGANKYFRDDPYLQRNIITPRGSRLSSYNDSLYHSHSQISMSKLQNVNPTACSTPHRSLHRNNFTPFQNHILLEWYDKHKNKPYPSTDDTKHLSVLCGLSYPQVKKWFANKRARSTFYQKNDILVCDDDIGCDMMRFPLRVSGRLNDDIARSMEAQFRKSMGIKMPSANNNLIP